MKHYKTTTGARCGAPITLQDSLATLWSSTDCVKCFLADGNSPPSHLRKAPVNDKVVHVDRPVFMCGPGQTNTMHEWNNVTCELCLEYGATQYWTAAQQLARLTGDVVHAAGSGTWCGKGWPGTGSWQETTCLECLDAGNQKGRAEDIRAGKIPGVGKDGRYIVAGRKGGVNPYPHVCPRCRAPAYIGFTDIECSKKCR